MTKQVLNKDFIEVLKNDESEFQRFLAHNTSRNIVYVLTKFGRLDNDRSKNCLLSLLNDGRADLRKLAISNLAKLGDHSLLDTFFATATQDESTTVRREAVSAIGRMRTEKSIDNLTQLLSDDDPKVVMQAVRGLLVFKEKEEVSKRLKQLRHHPNEMIQYIIAKEFFRTPRKSKQKHNEFPLFLKDKIVHGNVLDVLEIVDDESVHLTFTSPPYYNARDYAIYKSYEQYLDFLEEVFQQVHRVTKEGRFFVLNTSPIIIPRVGRSYASRRYPIPYDIHSRLVAMGWEYIDDIIWVKPEASVKNRTAGFLQHRKPLAYKPNCVSEMLMVYRKQSYELIDWNIKQYPQEIIEQSKVQGDYDTSNVWHIDPCFDQVHSAVFPQELCERVIKYYSFVKDLIFDPFAGSGTLGKAANTLQRHFFMTEKKKTYFDLMREHWGGDVAYQFASIKKLKEGVQS